jgi:hypothetical protein
MGVLWIRKETRLTGGQMIRDLLLAILITVIAVVLGIVVHPLLFLLLVLAVIWLFARRTAW